MLMKKSVNGVPPPSVVLASPGSTLRSASLRSASLRSAPGEAKTTEGGGTPFTDFFMSISFSALYTKSRKGRRLTDLGTEGAAEVTAKDVAGELADSECCWFCHTEQIAAVDSVRVQMYSDYKATHGRGRTLHSWIQH